MIRFRWLVCAAVLLPLSAHAAQQGLALKKTIPLAMAQEMANAAYDSCVKAGQHASIAVVDGAGITLVILGGEGSSPITPELARQKAYTSVMMQRTGADYVEMVNAAPNRPPMAPGIVPFAGGVPIVVDGAVIGAIAASGGKGNGADENCARAGITKVQDRLK